MKMLLKLKCFLVLLLLSGAIHAQVAAEIFEGRSNIQKQQELRDIMLENKQPATINDQVSNSNQLVLPYNPAFFCLIEDKIEAKSKLPLRVRLGSLPAVDAKEGKGCGFNSRADKADY